MERYSYSAILIKFCAISLAVTLHQQVSRFRHTFINLFEAFIGSETESNQHEDAGWTRTARQPGIHLTMRRTDTRRGIQY